MTHTPTLPNGFSRGRFVAEQQVPLHVIEGFERHYRRLFDLTRDDDSWRNTWRYKHNGVQSRWEGWRDCWLSYHAGDAVLKELAEAK